MNILQVSVERVNSEFCDSEASVNVFGLRDILVISIDIFKAQLVGMTRPIQGS